MTKGPDFTQATKDTLARRAGQTCSNPGCRKPTSGPHTEADKAVNLGEAAHIKGARKGSENRYDAGMTNEERSNISNGIWLCIACARMIDTDQQKYTVAKLNSWKEDHERWIEMGKPSGTERDSLPFEESFSVEPQRFFWRSIHREYKVNANAERVYNFLLQKYTEIIRLEKIDDSVYSIEQIRAFNPEEHDTFQYGIIASGQKITERSKANIVAGVQMSVDPLGETLPEMFFITISQGGEDVSIVSFDTDIRQVARFSDWLARELSKGFSIIVLE